MPTCRLHEIDRVAVASDATTAWAVVRDTDLYEIRLIRALFAARLLPEQVGARLSGRRIQPVPRTARLDEIVAPGSGFHLLEEVRGREFVAGAVGKFWQPTITFAPVDSTTFRSFAEPGHAKVAWSLAVHPREGGGAWVTVDVRVDATDDPAWMRFEPYWSMIGRFSRMIRRSLLRAVVRELGHATPDDERDYSGDEFLPNARASNTMSIDIEAPPSKVWPWLVQMGCRRGGWYSIDSLDNGGVPSAERIHPELQTLAVGDILPASPKSDDGFAVLRLDHERSMVLGSPSLLPSSLRNEREGWALLGAPYQVSWAFVLEPIGDDATHLVVRVRAGFAPSVGTALTSVPMMAAHLVMEHAQLHHIKRHAESA